MANLLDQIRQNSQQMASQKQGLTDETSKLSTLLRAKSGREVGGGDTGASNLGEQQAVANTNNQMQNIVAPAAAIQAAGQGVQAATQEQELNQQKSDIAQSRNLDTVQTRIRTDALLQNLEQSRGKLDQQQRDASVNQIAQNLRLQNAQYVDSLQREGARNRLDNENDFNQAIAQTTFGDNKELLETSLGNKSILDASDRDFSKAMGSMSTENAYDIFKNDMKSQKERGMYQAIGGLVTAGVGAAGKYSERKSEASPAATSAKE